jgi:hypothetical protein
MPGGIGCKANKPPASSLLDKVTVFQFFILFFCQIPDVPVRLTSFLHLHRKLNGGGHAKYQRGNGSKKKCRQHNRQYRRKIPDSVFLKIPLG